jgi:hypothetical protein
LGEAWYFKTNEGHWVWESYEKANYRRLPKQLHSVVKIKISFAAPQLQFKFKRSPTPGTADVV